MKRCQSDPSSSKVEWFCSPPLLFIRGSCFFSPFSLSLSVPLTVSLPLFQEEKKEPLERSGGYMRIIRASLVANYETLHILCTCCSLRLMGDKCTHEQAFLQLLCVFLCISPPSDFDSDTM